MRLIIVPLLNGISYGGMLFLVASGLSLVLGLMGVANMAHGALFILGSFVGWTIAVQHGANFWLAAAAGAAAAALVGFIIERGFLRRLHGMFNEQVLLTIGFVYIIQNFGLWVWTSTPKMPFVAVEGSFMVAGWPYPFSRVIIIALGLVVAAVLWWLQDKTRFGAIVRAGMEDQEVTQGLGINVVLASSILFVVGSALAGFAGTVGAQMIGANLENAFNILVLALIIIVVGGVGSVQGALLGAMIIGVVNAYGQIFFQNIALFLLYIVMIIILLIKPSGLLGRPLELKAFVQPVLRVRFRGRFAQLFPYLAAVVVLTVVPVFLPTYLQSIMTKVLIYGLFAISVNIVFGYTGLLSLGHAAFFGVAGYTAGILITKFGISNLWIVIPASIAAAALTAAILGAIALRVSGLFFLLVTFACGQALFSLAISWYSFTNGTEGMSGMFLPVLPFYDLTKPLNLYYLVLMIFAVCYFLLYRLVKSPFGIALQGIRDCEPRMRSLGYNTWLYKYIGFVISGVFCGIAGIVFSYFNGSISPAHLGFSTSSLALLMIILGGVGSLWGPLVGAGVIIFVQTFVSMWVPARWPAILGAILVLAVMFVRGGISFNIKKLAAFLNKYQGGSRTTYGSIKG